MKFESLLSKVRKEYVFDQLVAVLIESLKTKLNPAMNMVRSLSVVALPVGAVET